MADAAELGALAVVRPDLLDRDVEDVLAPRDDVTLEQELRDEEGVHDVVRRDHEADRLTDGQFDECDITLRELHLIEHSLVKNLAAIHHGRVKYPKALAEESGEAERQASSGSDVRIAAHRAGEVARQA